MKKLIIFGLGLFLLSCTSKQGEEIGRFEQTSGDTFTDLSFKVIKLKKVKTITANDSLDFYFRNTNKTYNLDSLESDLKKNTDYLDDMQNKYTAYIDSFNVENEKSKPNIGALDYYREMADIANPANYLEITNDIAILNQSKVYFAKPDSILGNLWECTYSIKNPLMDDAKQELTDQYIFSPDNQMLISKVIK